MIHYRISPLDSNKTILEQLEDIKKYLTENPQYQVFYYNGNYINTTNTYEVSNIVLNARTINKGDIVLFANSYYAVVDAIGNNNFVVEHAIEMNSQAILDLRNFVISNYQTKLTFDNIPKSGSNNPVTSDGIFVALQLDKQDLSDAIQELTESIANNYQTKLTFDTVPTLNSNNPVTSDGIKKALTETVQTEHQVPSGGLKGQVLTKISNENYLYDWRDLYPIGSIYMSVNDTSPASIFGGSWEKIKDTFLLGSGDTYTNGNSGGEATHKLTYGEMPIHNHDERFSNSAYSSYEGFSEVSQEGTRTVNGVLLPTYNYTSVTGAYNYLTTGYKGNDEAHNNMPPYLVVNMWKRVA
ncbi:hypothetical protein [Clostridium sp.]|uniref:phage baseplate protein n=1 Tax=Clostridium sp. TaxID=1506 RepID=UPI0025C4DBB6|nr:hypothetical protein [Clostridium sp.]